jgi:phosphatidate cytidylyltransferase
MAEPRSALRSRVATALVLAPVAIAGVLFLPTPWLAALFGAIVALGALEWARLGGLPPAGVPAWLLVAYQLALLWLGDALSAFPGVVLVGLGLAAGWWLGIGITLALRRTPVVADLRLRPLLLAGAPLLTALAWLALVRLHAVPGLGPRLVLSLLVLIWVADTAAYFSGRALGRRKLAPAVSPGKTLEGLAGALIGAATLGLVLAELDLLGGLGPIAAAGLCLGVALLSVAGDLFESYAKRSAGLKDSGTLLPGHGGVLDRIDSLVAAAPVFLLGLLLLWRPA